MSLTRYLRRLILPFVSGLPPTYWYVWAGTLVNRLGGFVVPFLALYLTDARGLSVSRTGLVVSLYGAGSIGAGPVGGWLADRAGRRPVLILSLIAGGAAMLALGFARTPEAIGAAALTAGFFYELYRPVVSAVVADVVEPPDRVRAYGLLYWAVNFGGAIAVIVAGIMSSYSYLAIFIADAATTLLYGLIVWLRVPETKPVRETAAGQSTTSSVLGDGTLMAFCGLTFLFALIFFQHIAALPVDMRARGVPPVQYGAVLAVNGLLIVLLQPFAARFAGRIESSYVLAAAAVFVGAGFGMNGWIGSAPLYAAAVAVWTLGEILFAPVSTSVVAELAPLDLRGRYQGAFAMSFGLAVFAAPALGAFVLERFGSVSLWAGCFVLGLVIAAANLALGPARRRRLAEGRVVMKPGIPG